jgi:hypothetical protein
LADFEREATLFINPSDGIRSVGELKVPVVETMAAD